MVHFYRFHLIYSILTLMTINLTCYMLSPTDAFILSFGDSSFYSITTVTDMLKSELVGSVTPGCLFIDNTLYIGFHIDPNLEWCLDQYKQRLHFDHAKCSTYIMRHGNSFSTGSEASPILERQALLTNGIRSSAILTRVNWDLFVAS